MSVFKCKMCGAELNITAGQTVCECDYCGSVQTLPRMDDDRKANLYDRANHFRRNNEFDKAAAVYEKLLQEDTTDAEAYWSLVLCRYGIEYVEDPATRKRVPTVNRAQFTSILDDENYRQAIAHADMQQKRVYEDEAKVINEIQKGILAISQKEEPFDVFICYKETDANGRRTQDSVLANDLYHQLKQEGFKVFFSRITLEDKLGTAYEPYIFAALNSARVMVVLGTKPEHFNAVWVKNEWSRYLAIVKQSAGKKLLIPAYRDMDPYDLPEEFSHLQAQDMGKLGFMQDLIRGVKKILNAGKPQEVPQQVVRQTVVSSGSAEIAPLYRRATLFLEDGDFDSAKEYADRILDIDPEYAPAYMVKVLAAHRARNENRLMTHAANPNLPNDPDATKAVRFSKDGSVYTQLIARVAENATLLSVLEKLGIARDKSAAFEAEMDRAMRELEKRIKSEGTHDADEGAYKAAAAMLRRLKTFPKAGAFAALCDDMAKLMPKLLQYEQLIQQVNSAPANDSWWICKTAMDGFDKFAGFRNSRDMRAHAESMMHAIARKLYDEYCAEIEKTLSKETVGQKLSQIRQLPVDSDAKKKAEDLSRSRIAEIEAMEAESRRIEAEKAAKEAAHKALMKRLEIAAAIAAAVIIAALILNSKVIQPNRRYNAAKALYEAGQYEEAITAFEAMEGYKDSADQIAICVEAKNDRDYNAAKALYEAGQYEEAITAFEAMGGYKDSADQIKACKYDAGKALYDKADYKGAYAMFATISGYKDVDKLVETDYNLAAAAAAAPYTQIGNVVTYGHYEQDDNTSNGKEAIEWIVLDYDADKGEALLISKYGLEAKQYHHDTPYPTWEKSDVRAWLNDDFLNAAFTTEEQKGIQTVKISTPSYSGNSGGNDTQDKIWLLSRDESEEYFKSDEARQTTPTKYAVSTGAWQSSSYEIDGTGCCWWWLRSPGFLSSSASGVSSSAPSTTTTSTTRMMMFGRHSYLIWPLQSSLNKRERSDRNLFLKGAERPNPVPA